MGYMELNTKSILIARKKFKENSDLPYLLQIKFFDINNPHMTAEVPKKTLEYKDIESVEISGLKVSYFIRGNDVVLNDAGSVKITQLKNSILIEKV